MWNQDLFQKTVDFAAQGHKEQEYPGRGYNYIVHPVVVAMEALGGHILEPCDNPDLLMQCALLHDILEDTKITSSEIEKLFGISVLKGVKALTKNKSLEKSKQMKDSINRIIEEPKEIAMVKLADRITNLQEPPGHWTKEKKEYYQIESEIILNALGEKHRILKLRLMNKIKDYSKYI